MDLSNASTEELKSMRREIATLLEEFETSVIGAAKDALDEIEDYDVFVESLSKMEDQKIYKGLREAFQRAQRKKSRGRYASQQTSASHEIFVHPTDPDWTWNGIGRKPHWVKSIEAKRKANEDHS